jgi:hypothetical protein
VLKSNCDFLSFSCTNTIHMSSMFSGRSFKVLTSKRRKKGASSSGEDSPHDESYVPSQSEVVSSYASGSYDILIKKARMVCTYEQEEDSLTPQFRTKVQHDAFYGHLVNKYVCS